jgi:nitrous oxidase accessory protein NosD
MKTYVTTILVVASLSSALTLSGYAVNTITAIPFTITKPGKYILEADLTLSGTSTTAVTVSVSDVVIDLNGFTLSTSASPNTGISVSTNVTNVTIQNGTITGFDFAIAMQGPQQLLQNLRLLDNIEGVYGINCTFSTIQNCVIQGLNAASNIGIDLASCSDVAVKNNQILRVGDGCFSSGSSGSNSFIANYIADCTIGLDLESGDKYQSNVATRCTTNFMGGIAVGQENG